MLLALGSKTRRTSTKRLSLLSLFNNYIYMLEPMLTLNEYKLASNVRGVRTSQSKE